MDRKVNGVNTRKRKKEKKKKKGGGGRRKNLNSFLLKQHTPILAPNSNTKALKKTQLLIRPKALERSGKRVGIQVSNLVFYAQTVRYIRARVGMQSDSTLHTTLTTVQFRIVQDGIYALEKAHMRSTLIRSFPNVAFETVPMLV